MPDPTVPVRVAGSQFRYDGEQYTEGDEIEVHEGALDRHPRTLEAIEEDDGDADSGSDEDEGEGEDAITVDDLDPHPSDLTNDEIAERVQDTDNVELLETHLEAEEADKDRDGATDAIESRIADLTESEDGDAE